MPNLEHFTVIGNYKSFWGQESWDGPSDMVPHPVSGTIIFTPITLKGDSFNADLDAPTRLVLEPVQAQIKDGVITRKGMGGCKLVANAHLNLAGDLYYRVTFFDVRSSDGKLLDMKEFNFAAPTTDSTVDLVTVTPGPGNPALGTAPPVVGPIGPQGPKGDPGPAGPPGEIVSSIELAADVKALDDADVIPAITLPTGTGSASLKRITWANIKATVLTGFSDISATFTGKTIDGKTNTFTNIPDTALPDTVVYTTKAQSLSNKTLVTPTITAGGTAVLKTSASGVVGIYPVVATPNALVAIIGHTELRAASQNVSVGYHAHAALTTGDQNVSVGFVAQSGLTVGSSNSAFGRAAQTSLKDGNKNSAFGAASQQQLTSGSLNTAVGFSAQHAPLGTGSSGTKTASKQTSVGAESGQLSATQVDGITTIGYQATSGNANGVAVGILSRCQHNNAVALGANTNTTADDQVAVGPRDVEIGDATKGLVLKSPDGKQWRVTVNNAGALSAAAV